MSFLDRLKNFNNIDFTKYTPLIVDGDKAGWVKNDGFLNIIKEYDDIFNYDGNSIIFQPDIDNFDKRTKSVNSVINDLITKELFQPLKEKDIYGAWSENFEDKCYFTLPREWSNIFGTWSKGAHANCITKDELMWIAKRSATKKSYPNKLDQMVAGGTPYSQTPFECIIREANEEARLQEKDITNNISEHGHFKYLYEQPEGIEAIRMYCFDILIDDDITPKPNDGEVESFTKMPIDEVLRLTYDTDEFKPNCALVNLDFFIRHKYITKDNYGDYDELVAQLYS